MLHARTCCSSFESVERSVSLSILIGLLFMQKPPKFRFSLSSDFRNDTIVSFCLSGEVIIRNLLLSPIRNSPHRDDCSIIV